MVYKAKDWYPDRMRDEKDRAKVKEFGMAEMNKSRVNVHHPFLFSHDDID